MADKLFRDYFNEKVTDTVLPANAKVLIQDGTGEPTQINASSISTGQLVKVTENGKTGYRLKDADPANYGDIGLDAVDLSIPAGASTTRGATGDYSHASGFITTASGYASNASGVSTIASGNFSNSSGESTTASGASSHAEGNGTTASGNSSHAQGADTTASGFASHAEGNSTEASGYASHAEGDTTTASEESAHAEGIGTTASGYASHSEGNETTASGQASHAEGSSAIASGSSSHAEGSSTFARSLAEHSGGVNGTDYTPQSATGFNLIDRLVNYGNGTDYFDRSDAYTLFKNGMQKFFTAALSTITNAVKGSVMLDENARLNIHDGTAFKAVAFSSEVDAKISGSGTTNRLAKFTASGAVGNSEITELANGRVGFKANNPTTDLQIGQGTGLRQIYINGGGYDLLLGTSGGGIFGFASQAITSIFNTISVPLALGTNNSQPLIFGTAALERARIDAIGNFGINQTNPTERLDVVGNGKFSGTVTASNFIGSGSGLSNVIKSTGQSSQSIEGNATGIGQTLLIKNNAYGSTDLTGENKLTLGWANHNAAGISAYKVSTNRTGLKFFTELGFNTAVEAVRIIESGNVGINQPNPTEVLDVVGNGKFSGTVSCGQFTTATEPAYVKGAQFFNTTLNKIRIGGATAYETVTSS